MNHTLKLLLSMLNVKIEKKLDENLSEIQYGFVSKKGIKDAIALIKVVIQKAPNANRVILACFIDYAKGSIVSIMRRCLRS